MAAGFRVHWLDHFTGRNGLFDALVIEHTPGTMPALCRLIKSPAQQIKQEVVELHAITSLAIEGLLASRHKQPHPVSLQTAAEDHLKTFLDDLSDAEQQRAYRYLYALGCRISRGL